MKIKFNKVKLSKYTTIGLGGNAKYFAKFRNVLELNEAINFAKINNLTILILGGGSNIIFKDEGFDGLVLKNEIKEIFFNETKNYYNFKVGAGISWDDFVIECISKSIVGIECLSGIPGTVGATPIQNVGAYGQEVSQVIDYVECIDQKNLEKYLIPNEKCNFTYRNSIFKKNKKSFIITYVNFKFKKNSKIKIAYNELNKIINQDSNFNQTNSICDKLKIIREKVLSLRSKKSMIYNSKDIYSKSVGSFFTNPILSKNNIIKLNKICKNKNLNIKNNIFEYGDKYKISAAWLIENSGFKKGFRYGGVGISKNHSLALVNFSGTTKEILKLAEQIEENVWDNFKVKLKREAFEK